MGVLGTAPGVVSVQACEGSVARYSGFAPLFCSKLAENLSKSGIILIVVPLPFLNESSGQQIRVKHSTVLKENFCLCFTIWYKVKDRKKQKRFALGRVFH
jgi:hypothetical protein